MEHTLAVAVSGGVDSFVATYLLKQQGADLFGIHFTTGYEAAVTDFSLMEMQLGIPVYTIDLSKEFKQHVIDYFTLTYLSGKTPNPCLKCNKSIKFDALFKAAKKRGADVLATGHYARIIRDQAGNSGLYKGKDPLKEQSYFLSMLSSDQLEKAVFPLGDMKKEDVVRLAADKGFDLPVKAESQDICFIPDKSFSDFFIKHNIMTPKPGNIITTDGKPIGKHNGLHGFTIGQRRKINCPGPRPYYVNHIDMESNTLVVGFENELYKKTVTIDDVNIIGPPLTCPITVTAKIRYAHEGAKALLIPEGATARLVFDVPQRAVTPGQGAVFYENEKVLGAGIIQ